MDRDLEKFFAHITDIDLALWPSSWGRLQCNARTSQDKLYHSWSGLPSDKLSIDLIVESFRLIGKQLE